MAYGTVEMGGTKTSVAVGTTVSDLHDVTTFPTTDPGTTLGRVTRSLAESGVDAVGVACFGPVGLDPSAPDYGRITVTPKPGWSGVDVVGALGGDLGVPVGFDTDVDGSALGEWKWGSGAGLRNIVYVTVGTGIGAGALVDGRPLHGLGHPEMGHLVVRRAPGDDFTGSCPFHGDCLEGMASGPAIEARFGAKGESLSSSDRDQAVDLVGSYLAQMARNLVYALAPERIVFGGGVMQMPGLLARVRSGLLEELAGYPGLHDSVPDYVTSPGLGPLSALAGGLLLAARAFEASHAS